MCKYVDAFCLPLLVEEFRGYFSTDVFGLAALSVYEPGQTYGFKTARNGVYPKYTN